MDQSAYLRQQRELGRRLAHLVAGAQPATFVPDPAEEARCVRARRMLAAWVSAGILPGPAPVTGEAER